MKRKYCLVRNQGELGVNSFVYVVWVGSSLRESVYLSLVEEFCKDCGWYFKRWSPQVDSALELRCKMKRVDGNRFAKPYRFIAISIRQCYETIIDDSWVALDQSYKMSPFEKMLRFANHPEYLMAMNTKKRTTTCPPSRRKYLSHGKSRAFYELTPYMVAIVLLLLLDAFVSNYIL